MILIYFTILTLLGLLSYYLIFSCLNLPEKLHEQKSNVEAISLIICAKNELENLKKHLPFWTNQTGISYELIIVNDASTDGTKEWLEAQRAIYPRMKCIHLDAHQDESLKGKRYALWQGIKASTYDYVVLSDADCWPVSQQWLLSMASKFEASIEIVLGFSPYEHQSGFLNKLIRYETLMTALQYLSFAKIGIPYMGVGRNIAYKKDLLSYKAFSDSNKSVGGDDDLMVVNLANKKNTAIQINPESFVYSIPVEGFKAWFKQKQRHYSTAKYYPFLLKLGVGGFGALNLLFYILMFTLVLTEVKLLSVLSIYLFKNLAFVFLNFRSIGNFKESGILKNILYIDVVYLILLIINHLKALRVKYGWS